MYSFSSVVHNKHGNFANSTRNKIVFRVVRDFIRLLCSATMWNFTEKHMFDLLYTDPPKDTEQLIELTGGRSAGGNMDALMYWIA